jgi:hypothetical protein
MQLLVNEVGARMKPAIWLEVAGDVFDFVGRSIWYGTRNAVWTDIWSNVRAVAWKVRGKE